MRFLINSSLSTLIKAVQSKQHQWIRYKRYILLVIIFTQMKSSRTSAIKTYFIGYYPHATEK